jgi:hypothetical protein
MSNGLCIPLASCPSLLHNHDFSILRMNRSEDVMTLRSTLPCMKVLYRFTRRVRNGTETMLRLTWIVLKVNSAVLRVP